MYAFHKTDICAKSVKKRVEEGIRLVGETEMKEFCTEEMTLA